MGAKFDQWLARPSTLHFLRQLINVEGHARLSRTRAKVLRSGCIQVPSRNLSTLKTSREESKDIRQDGRRKPLKWSYQAGGDHSGNDMKLAALALRMSLKAGVPFLDKDIRKEQSFGEMRYQADVRAEYNMGKLLVDEPENTNNTNLWIEILRFRQRFDGLDGIIDVWKGMRKRAVDLPVAGEDAEILWSTFAHAAVPTGEDLTSDSRQFLKEVFNYAVDLKHRTGLHFHGLYKCIVGRFLRLDSWSSRAPALKYSHLLFQAGFQPPDAVVSIVIDAMLSPRRDKALQTLKTIYLNGAQRELYDACISEALKLDDDAGALYLHQMLIKAGDGPSTEMFSTPGVQRLFDLDKDESLPMRTSTKDRKHHPELSDLNTLRKELPQMTRASMNTIVGDVHGIKSKEISDHFCARLFATRAFSVDLVIGALSLFGVDKLGPLATREMAVRCVRSPIEFANKLDDAKTRGITVGSHVYSQIVSRIVKEGQTSLWTVLLESDQHPEAYSDVATQEALLVSFLEQHKWAHAHIALLALTLAGAPSSVRAWNLLLQHYLQHQEYRPMLSTFQSMQSQKLPLQQSSVKDMFWRVLPERQHGKRPLKGRGPIFFDPLDFVTNALIYASENGTIVHGTKWKELLKRYGKDHRWDDVERLVLWLVDHYSPEKSASMLGLGRNVFAHRKRVLRRVGTLQDVFTPQMRQALFTWSYRSASVRKKLISVVNPDLHRSKQQLLDTEIQPEPWARGLALQKKLKEAKISTIPVPIGDVRRAFALRMWILFGPAYSTLGLNNEARRENRLSLAHYIRHANEVWNGLIDWVDPALLEQGQGNEERLLLAFFGPVRGVSLKRREYVDVRAWIHRLAALKSNEFYVRRITPARQAAWESSGLRLVPVTPRYGKHQSRIEEPNGLHPLQERQSLAAREANSHQPPSQLYNPEWS